MPIATGAQLADDLDWRPIQYVTMPVHPYDPERDDEDDRTLPDIGDIIDRIIRGGGH